MRAFKVKAALLGCVAVTSVWAEQPTFAPINLSALPISGSLGHSLTNFVVDEQVRATHLDPSWLELPHLAPHTFTLGYAWRNLKLEGSAFSRPDVQDKPFLIASSRPSGWTAGRFTYSPTPKLILQLSRGQRNRPDQLDPNDEIRRTTVSTIYNHEFDRSNWQTTLAIGRNARRADGAASGDAYLLESLLRLQKTHTFFGRMERATSDELFLEDEQLRERRFNARKFTVGYVYDFTTSGPVKFSIGALSSKRVIPSQQVAAFGADPVSYKAFMRLTLQFP